MCAKGKRYHSIPQFISPNNQRYNGLDSENFGFVIRIPVRILMQIRSSGATYGKDSNQQANSVRILLVHPDQVHPFLDCFAVRSFAHHFRENIS